MRVVVGVDAGGSSTVAAVAHGEEELRSITRPPANARVRGPAAALETIADAIARVLEGDEAAAIAVGVAGAANESVAATITSGLRVRFPGVPVTVSSDAAIALRGAIPKGDGIVLIAGTGSVAYAEAGGLVVRMGGAGFAIGDDGSGYAIGSAALKVLVRSFEGRAPRDGLSDALAATIGAASAGDVVEYVYGRGEPVAAVAAVAPVVIAAANAGERSANKILQTAALELFELVRAACGAVRASERELPLAFAGGLLRENSLLTYLVETRIANELPRLSIVKGGGLPYRGALAKARALLLQ